MGSARKMVSKMWDSATGFFDRPSHSSCLQPDYKNVLGTYADEKFESPLDQTGTHDQPWSRHLMKEKSKAAWKWTMDDLKKMGPS
jgi:hypothetical protein